MHRNRVSLPLFQSGFASGEEKISTVEYAREKGAAARRVPAPVKVSARAISN